MAERDVMIGRARRLRREQTDAERALWRILRSRRLEGWKFRRQVPLGPYIADFCCLEARLVVEADGSQHEGSAYDAERDGWLRAQGFHVLRVWNSEVLREPEGVAAAVITALEAAASFR